MKDEDMTLIIREINSEDIKPLAAFFREVITATFVKEGLDDLVEDIDDEVKDKNEKVLKSLNPSSVFRFFVAEKDDNIVGTLSINEPGQFSKKHMRKKIENVLEIGSVYIKPEYQSQGVGKRLLRHATDFLKVSGYDHFVLDSGFIKAQKVWEHLLGEPEVVLKDFWGSGNDHMFWLKQI